MTTVPTPTPPNYLDDGGTAFAPTAGGTQTGYGQVAGAAASFYIGGGATAWNGVAVINVTAIATASGQTYTLVIQGSTTSGFASPVTLGTIQVAAVGQYLVPLFAYSGGVLYPYLRLEKIVSGASPSITLNAFPLPFSGLSSLSIQDATAVFGLAAQNTQQIAASIVAWASGTATGGPNGNGHYPIYDAAGDSVLVPCPAVAPAGPTGPTGPAGPTGATGPAGPAGASSSGGAGMVKAGLQESFDQVMARLNFSVHTDYLFGTSAVAGAGQTAITNLAQLEALYNAYEGYTGTTRIATEQCVFEAFNALNFAFASDRLNLTAVLDTTSYSGGYSTVVSQNSGYTGVTPYGTAQPYGPTNLAPPAGSAINTIPIANLGWADTSHVQLGQLVYLQYMGMYYVSQLTPNTSVQLTLLSSGPYQATVYSNFNVVMPYFAAPFAASVTATGTPVTTFTFTSLPAGVEVGQAFGWAVGGNALTSTNDMRVTAINGNSVTLSNGPTYTTIAASAVGIFGPPITSAQLWSQEFYDFTGSQTAAWAFDWHIYLPTDETGGYNTINIGTLSALAGVPADFPWGAWPALWFYSAQEANANALGVADSSEIDVIEGFYGSQGGPWLFNGTDHPGGSDATTQASESNTRFQKYGRSSNYTLIGSGIGTPFSMANGQVRISIIVTPTDTYRYVNGVLLKWAHFEWSSIHFAQMGMDMAVGSMGGYNMQLLLQAENLNNMKLGISRLTVRKI